MRTYITILSLLFTTVCCAQNLFSFPENEKWGFINSKGEVVIQPIFDAPSRFQNGFAVIEGIDITVIDTLGSIILKFKNPDLYADGYCHQYSEGLLAAYETNSELFGFVDKFGNWVLDPQYFRVHDFSDGLAAVWEDPNIHVDVGSGCGTPMYHPKWGFIDHSGNYTIQPKYSEVSSFNNGHAVISGGVIINKSGEEVSFDSVSDPALLFKRAQYTDKVIRSHEKLVWLDDMNFENCRILARDSRSNKYGFLDYNGEWIIDPIYKQAQYFSDGLAGVQNEIGLWGYIDCSGNMLIKPKYQFVYYFSESFGAVQLNDVWGFVDRTGDLKIPCQFDERRKFEQGMVRVEKRNKTIYLDKFGNVIWQEE